MSNLDPVWTAALTQAVGFLFDHAGKILQERRELRKARADDDDTPALPAGAVPTAKAEVEAWQPKTIYLQQNHEQIKHVLDLIQRYHKNRNTLRLQLASFNGPDNAPIKLLNDLESAENSIKTYAQELKEYVENVYGHRITIIGLN